MDERRYHGLDALRAAAMLLGIVLHAAMFYVVQPSEVVPLKDPRTSPVFDLVILFIHNFRMPLFFLLCGFFAALLVERHGMQGAFRNRAARVLAPFLLAMATLLPATGYMMLSFGLSTELGGQRVLFSPSNPEHKAWAQAFMARVNGGGPGHLWFLYYLMMLYLLLPVCAWAHGAIERRGLTERFERFAGSSWWPLPLALLTGATLLPYKGGVVEGFQFFRPHVPSLVYYGLFFVVGHLLYAAKQFLASSQRLLGVSAALALPLFVASLGPTRADYLQRGSEPWLHVLACLLNGLLTWSLIVASIGLFQRLFDRDSPWIAYVSQSSYWVYLAHLPIVSLAAWWLATVEIPAEAKFLLAGSFTTVVAFASYHYLVRRSWISVLLNGRRFPQGWPWHARMPRGTEEPLMKRAAAGAVLLLSLSEIVGAADPKEAERFWGQWRGPRMDGVARESNPPLEWSETRNVKWKIALPGLGSSTPVVWKDRLYVLAAIPEGGAAPALPPHAAPKPAGAPAAGPGGPGGGRPPAEPLVAQEFTVFAINRSDGKVAWRKVARKQVPHEAKQQNNSFASGSAIVDGEHVVAYFGSWGIYCYDMQGRLVWEKDLGDMQTRNSFGEGASPALSGDTLVVTWDHEGQDFIVALDKKTGKELWRRDRDEPTTWATPLIVEHDGRRQVITPGTNKVRSYDLKTGEQVWEAPGLTPNAIPTAVESQGVVYLTAGFRGNAARAIKLAGAKGDLAGSPAILWQTDRDTPYVPSPLLYQGVLYMVKSNNGVLTALDAANGQPLFGPQRLEGVAEIYASLLGAAGRVYVVGRDGNTLVLDGSREYKVLAKNSLDDGFDASPVAVGDELYLRGYRNLYRISK